MKKLYLILLMLLILFIPTSINAVAVYQLDQPVRELNGHTLREVFDDGNLLSSLWFDRPNTSSSYIDDILVVTALATGSTIGVQQSVSYQGYHYINVRFKSDSLNPFYVVQVLSSFVVHEVDTFQQNSAKVDYILDTAFRIYQSMLINETFTIDHILFIDMEYFGIDNLTVQKMDKYYDLYLEAVRFEQENIEASQDVGGYQNIFRSILNGVKNLISEMGYVWQWLNAPIITSDMQDFNFIDSIDWSWDLIGVVRQILNSIGILVLQITFWVPSLAFAFMGIPVQVSILSLLFSNLIFLLLGWIMVKSFII